MSINHDYIVKYRGRKLKETDPMMTAQELLKSSLNHLLTLKDSSHHLSFDQATDLSRALECLNDILTELEEGDKDWDAEGFSHFLKTKQERLDAMKDQLSELETAS